MRTNVFDKINQRTVLSSVSLLDAMKVMDERKVKTLFVCEGELFKGIITLGDIQRAIINNIALKEPIIRILNKKKVYGNIAEGEECIKEKMRKMRAEVMPILDENGELVDVWFWNDLFKKTELTERERINLPVVIMAGGKGTRLKPLTNVLPKPLIPIGEKTIIEVIMDQFEGIGCTKFFMSVNYKVEMMKFYFSQLEHHYDIEFFQEDKPLGTIGSVALLKGKINTPFIVSNCDIFIDQDFRDVYDYHKENKNDITIVTAVKTQRIPYGVIETGEDGLMVALTEKPDSTFMFNTGVYILNPNLIEEIPVGQMYHITDLIECVKAKGGRVGCFPVSDQAWHDMGEWPVYLKMINVL